MKSQNTGVKSSLWLIRLSRRRSSPSHFLPAFLIFFFTPQLLTAAWTDFLPRPFENGAELGFFSIYETDDNRVGDTSPLKWTDLFLKEKLTLYSNGFFYHPRFMQYRLSLAGALKQEDFEATFREPVGWTHDSSVEYETRLHVLPEHAYSLELFALRYEPLFKDQSATRRNNVETSRGGIFRYRKKPYFLNVKYIEDRIDSSLFSSQVDTFSASGQYFRRFVNGNQLSLDGGYEHADFASASDLEGNRDQYALGGTLDWKWARLFSSLTKDASDQESAISGIFENDHLAWQEQLTVYLPWNFRNETFYRYLKNDNVFEQSDGTITTLSDVRKEIEWMLIHRLFESLDSRYTFRHDDSESTGGETTSRSHSLTLNYTKSVPKGRLRAGLNVGRAVTDSQGVTDVVSEAHPGTQVPGSFVLGNQQVDEQSIEVFLRSPLPPFETIQLIRDLHYTISPFAGTFQITIITLPPRFTVPGTYDFIVSYSLLTGNFELQSDTFGYNASVQLFQNLLTPYYSFVRAQSEVLSGFFPGDPVDSMTHTGGLIFHKGPFRALGEYQNFDWNISPFRAWRAEISYVDNISETTSIYSTANYVNRRYFQGSSSQPGVAYTEETVSATANIRQKLFAGRLLFSAGGSYSHLEGLFETEGYSVNSNLFWKVGKLDFSLGATAYKSKTRGGIALPNERTHTYYYLNVRRQLF